MPDATGVAVDARFGHADLTAFCRLDELGLEVTGQHHESDRAVLACRVVEPADSDERWCRRRGCYVTVIIDLTGIRSGTGPTRLPRHTGTGLLADKQIDRLTRLFADDRHVEVEATWGIHQRMIAAYREPDRGKGRQLMSALIASVGAGVPKTLTEVTTLGRTLKKRAPRRCHRGSPIPGRSRGNHRTERSETAAHLGYHDDHG